MSDKYAVIAAHRSVFDVRLMCRALSVSRAGFYAWQDRRPSAHAQADARLRVVVRAAFTKARARYGSPRVARALKQRGLAVGEKRVARVMRQEQLVARQKRRFVITTNSAHAFPVAANHVARDFAVGGPLNAVWASDVTFIPTLAGWLYLAVVLDLASRRVVGWATSAQNDTVLVLTALERGPGGATTDGGACPSFGSWQRLRESRVSRRVGGPRHRGEHESRGRLLG